MCFHECVFLFIPTALKKKHFLRSRNVDKNPAIFLLQIFSENWFCWRIKECVFMNVFSYSYTF